MLKVFRTQQVAGRQRKLVAPAGLIITILPDNEMSRRFRAVTFIVLWFLSFCIYVEDFGTVKKAKLLSLGAMGDDHYSEGWKIYEIPNKCFLGGG